MHFEILVEGQCELTFLSIIMPKIVGEYKCPNTWKIHKHRGIGSIPADPAAPPKVTDSSLLGQLPAKLRAYSAKPDPNRKVIVLLDIDDKDKAVFHAELAALLHHCQSPFDVHFAFAEEELEAWYFGDNAALLAYNPKINVAKLNGYIQDSICDTWKVLMDADDPALSKLGKRDRRILEKKVYWAKKIPPHMEVDKNISPSFIAFKNSL
ncbi:TPA: DUF4276 family protein [Klebsiella pneumoniae]|uniref:DUF4276 family protein n=1 Tax=Klebsiella TaxID=570 RepID=UPI0009B9541C|nr:MULTISPECIES: DUF4276 family protein [Klebsiella]HCM2942864.1 DUF4276 family protein [Klebsiella quasipneumoniae subsp. similipneumoniae]HED2273135.1 DUF4276 family protein [Klebsiella quasipneumoniae subsp. quasipneumoniae]EKX9435465.1 DUF4276 family protein [Klebsiella pneumoniae]MBK1449332.1 DUF4276 family protein [Klebsiella variicola]MCM5744386.1 DUF4276 family protein [Klebsiella pneumoniae]